MREKIVLVIDDDEMNLQIARMVLERKLPCKVICADNGVEGIEILKSQRVNLVLLDIMMPDFDGIETLQEIRSNSLINDVPVMMLTASGDPGNIQKASLLGVKDYIKKPFLPADLIMRVEKKLAEELPSTEIVIIGDNEKKLKNLKEIIENNFNHEVLIAANYEDAVKILREVKMQLIIANADMSFVDGFKILAFLASDERFKSIPFAVTTYGRIFDLLDKINKPEDEELPKVDASPKTEPPSVKEKAWSKAAKEEKKTPVVEEVADAVIAHSDKKKLANVVTTLIGYDLDLKA